MRTRRSLHGGVTLEQLVLLGTVAFGVMVAFTVLGTSLVTTLTGGPSVASVGTTPGELGAGAEWDGTDPFARYAPVDPAPRGGTPAGEAVSPSYGGPGLGGDEAIPAGAGDSRGGSTALTAGGPSTGSSAGGERDDDAPGTTGALTGDPHDGGDPHGGSSSGAEGPHVPDGQGSRNSGGAGHADPGGGSSGLGRAPPQVSDETRRRAEQIVKKSGDATDEDRQKVIDDLLAMPHSEEIVKRLWEQQVTIYVVHSDPEEHDPDTLPWAAGVYSEDSIIDTPIFSIEKRTIITIPDEKTLLHEVHHALDLADRDVESSSEEFLRAWNVDRRMYPGEYFARNEREGFAETWEKFYFDPLELARTQPNALAYALQDPLDYDPNADGNTRSRDFGEYTVTVELFPDGLVKHLVVTNDAGETVLETNFTRHDDGTLVAVTVENKNGQEERTVHIIRPDGTHRFERYRADGTLAETAEHDADGKLVRTEKFDEQGALVQTTEYRRFDDGSYTISTKDASGTITRVDLVDKDDHTTQTFEFDEDGNVTKRVEFEYHEDGTKKREHTFDYVADTEEDVEYNTNGSVARRTTTANGHTKTESFSYENNTTTQEIRVDGKLTTVEKTNADGSHETTVYDANENVDHIIATSADGRTVEWKRPDGSVRVRVTEDPSTGTTVRTELDPAGNVRSSTTTIEAPDGSGTTVEERDRSGALVASSTCENVGGSCRPARESFRDPATGELVTREFHYDASGVPTGSEARTAGGDLYATDERHPDGREKETKQYDASGNVVHEKRWIYGEGDELERTVDSTPTGETETYYENGVETRRIEYNADGTVEYGETYEYDANGNRIETERFDASGSVTERTTSDGSGTRRTERFEGGRLVETEVTTPTSVDRTRADGTVVSHTALNDNGQPTRTIAYDAQGNVESSTSYSYDPETGRLRTETRSTPGGPRVVTEYADDGTTTTREIPNRRGPI